MTPLPESAALQHVLAEAHDIAIQTDQRPSSAHLLLALFTVSNRAEGLLTSFKVSEETVLAQIGRMEREPADTLRSLKRFSVDFALSCDHQMVDCLHLLVAVTRAESSFAHRLLARSGVSIPRLRTGAIRAASKIPRVQVSRLSARQENDTTEMPSLVTVGLMRPDTMVNYPALTGLQPALPSTQTTIQTDEADAEADDDRRSDERRRGTRGRRSLDRGLAPNDRRSLDDEAGRPTSPFQLDDERYPTLCRLGRNLSHAAFLGKIDPVIGRATEIESAMDVLNKRRSNNPLLIGEPGVGKTAVVEGIALQLAEQPTDEQPPERIIIQLDVGSLLAGTHLRGALAERLRAIQDEVRDAEGQIVVFIDEIHTLIGAGAGDGAHDASNELKAALARGEFPCIGATTFDEYRAHFERDPAMERRFSPIIIDEPDAATTLEILKGVAPHYAKHHGVEYAPEALEAATRLGMRYLHERQNPDKSLSVLDLAGAVARRGRNLVDRRSVAEVISRLASVPLDHLVLDDPERFLRMETALGERIVGQSAALKALSETIRRNFAGFCSQRPIGSFLFLGPTGVGKTEVSCALAEFLFGRRDAMTRFDMSEYLEAHSLARLIGAPPGYVGHADGGQLTDAVRKRPYQILLFDEIEKSHRDVWNVLLQLLDDGRVTDSRGRIVDFTNTVVIMTSNLGGEALVEQDRRIGFAGDGQADEEKRREAALKTARKAFPPELWNRIESKLVFHALSRAQVKTVAARLVKGRSDLLSRERGIEFTASPEALDRLIELGGFDPTLGARPMRQAIGRELESALAEMILRGEVKSGQRVVIDAEPGRFTFKVQPAEGA